MSTTHYIFILKHAITFVNTTMYFYLFNAAPLIMIIYYVRAKMLKFLGCGIDFSDK